MSYATVRAITSPELAYLRTPGQLSKLYLAVFKPTAVYTARLASLPASVDRVVQIAYNTGSGTLANVLPDMTMYIGSSAGAYDLGVVRIRKAPDATYFYIGEESEVTWQSNCYLTVINEFDLWAKHINTVSDTVFYMDYDIAYTDQNSVFNPVPIMGSHRVLKLTGATVSTQFDWSNSYCLGSSISSYSVACSTASITNGTTATPTLQFSAEGWHTVILTVTAANGKTSVGVRYVYVYSDAVPPVTVFQLETCYCDYEVGGWAVSLTMRGEVNDVPDRTLCILFAEDYYGDTNVSMGQMPGSENILCVGKIAEEVVNMNPEQGEVGIVIQGMQYWLSRVYAFPTGVLLKTTAPTNWAEMQSPTVDKVLFRLLHWGSTATKIMDIYLTGDTKIASELISPSSNIWAQVQEISFATIYARPGVDKYGRMFCEVEPQVVPVASRTWPTVMTLTKDDWHESIRMQRVVVGETGMIQSSGVVVSVDGTGSAIFSLAPGHVFRRYGTPEVIDRLLLSTQALSNQFAALLLGWKNNPYPNNEITLSGNNRMIDCFPRQKIHWQVDASDTPRGFAFNTDFVPRRVEYRWDAESGYIEVSISLEMGSSEQLSFNGDIPGSGDYDPSDPPSPPPLPELPPFVPITPTDGAGEVNERVIVWSARYGLLYTTNFKSGGAGVIWQTINSGLTVSQYQNIAQVEVTPNGKIFIVVLISSASLNTNNGSGIYMATAPGNPFTPVVDYNWAITNYPSSQWNSPNGARPLCAFAVNPLQPEQIAFVTGGQNFTDFATDINFWMGTGAAPVKKVAMPEVNGFFGHMSYGGGKWIVTGEMWSYIAYWNSWFWRVNGAGTAIDLSGQTQAGGGQIQLICRASTSPTFYLFNYFGDGMTRTLDNGATFTPLTGQFRAISRNSFAADFTGQYLMGDWSTGRRGKSSDYGSTWSGLPALPDSLGYVFGFAGGTGLSTRFVAARENIYLTSNFGTTWEDKTGNIYADFPLSRNIQLVKVIG